jgi:uncharacterized protein YukE
MSNILDAAAVLPTNVSVVLALLGVILLGAVVFSLLRRQTHPWLGLLSTILGVVLLIVGVSGLVGQQLGESGQQTTVRLADVEANVEALAANIDGIRKLIDSLTGSKSNRRGTGDGGASNAFNQSVAQLKEEVEVLQKFNDRLSKQLAKLSKQRVDSVNRAGKGRASSRDLIRVSASWTGRSRDWTSKSTRSNVRGKGSSDRSRSFDVRAARCPPRCSGSRLRKRH